MLGFLGDLFDGIFGFTDDAINSTFAVTDGVINGVMGTTDAIIGGTVNVGSSVIDATIKVGLPIIKTAGELYISGLVGPALDAIPGPVGVVANLYDAADTVHGAFTALPDCLGEINRNFSSEGYRPEQHCSQCWKEESVLLTHNGRKLCSDCYSEAIQRGSSSPPKQVAFEATVSFPTSLPSRYCSKCGNEVSFLLNRDGRKLCSDCYFNAEPQAYSPPEIPIFQSTAKPTHEFHKRYCSKCWKEATYLFTHKQREICWECYSKET